MREEKVIVLDYLPQGYAGMKKMEPIIQGLGVNYFALLELVATKEVKLNEEVKINDKEKVIYIRRKLKESELTNFAKSHLEETIKKIVKSKEEEFIKFFNTSTRISIRMHKLELLPSIGKKHVGLILSERKKPFESFDDLKKRVGITVEIEQMLAKRIIEELKGEEKYYLFVPHFPTPTAPRR
ncbi:MAG: DUF655 domain-containing protein [Candidatus Aenigmatarchaeota archaeon]|nr:MAG: DUF655 domain-containing protein [Candidatus Aenigmarchaeota archaeon]